MRMVMFKEGPAPAKPLAAVLLLLCLGLSGAQESPSVRLGALWTGPYTMVERSDWSRYDNGKYTGHVYHEVRASIKPESPDNGREAFFYRGNFFVLEETLRDMRTSARPVNNIVPVSFKIFRDGNMIIEEDRGYPKFRGFPAFPREAVAPGARWTAQGQKAVDPRHTGRAALIPFIAEYEYRGPEMYQEIPVHRVAAKYAVRYQGQAFAGQDPGGPDFTEDFTGLQGTHTVDIIIQASNGLPLFIRDNLDETYSWADGSTLRFRGFTLIFSQGAAPINRETVIASLGNSLGIPEEKGGTGTRPEGLTESAPRPPPRPRQAVQAQVLPEPVQGLELAAVPEGVRLIVQDIRFVPDSEEFLREEWPRLDIIARALRQAAPEQNFLVEGHTASTGRPAGEMELSVRRAKRMVEELARRGLAEDRFIYKGWGGTKPLGDNNSEEGRARNRRVEITILD